MNEIFCCERRMILGKEDHLDWGFRKRLREDLGSPKLGKERCHFHFNSMFAETVWFLSMTVRS